MKIKPLPDDVQRVIWGLTHDQRVNAFGILGSMLIKFDAFLTFDIVDNDFLSNSKSIESSINNHILTFCSMNGYDYNDKSITDMLHDICISHSIFNKRK